MYGDSTEKLGITIFIIMILMSICLAIFGILKGKKCLIALLIVLIALYFMEVVIGAFRIKNGVDGYTGYKKDIAMLIFGSVVISYPIFIFFAGLTGLIISTIGYVRKDFFRKEMKQTIEEEVKKSLGNENEK